MISVCTHRCQRYPDNTISIFREKNLVVFCFLSSASFFDLPQSYHHNSFLQFDFPFSLPFPLPFNISWIASTRLASSLWLDRKESKMSDPNNPNISQRSTPQWGLYQRENFWKSNTGEVPLFNTGMFYFSMLMWMRMAMAMSILRRGSFCDWCFLCVCVHCICLWDGII